VLASAPPKEVAAPEQAAKPQESAKPAETAKPKQAAAARQESAMPKAAAVKPKKELGRKLAEAREPVPRPPANIPTGANSIKPR
jgi:hypothetical protein